MPWYFNRDLCHVVDVYDDLHAELDAIRTNVATGDMSRTFVPTALRTVAQLTGRKGMCVRHRFSARPTGG